MDQSLFTRHQLGKDCVKRVAMAVDDEISTAERPDVGFRQHLGSFVACRYDSKLWIEVLEKHTKKTSTTSSIPME